MQYDFSFYDFYNFFYGDISSLNGFVSLWYGKKGEAPAGARWFDDIKNFSCFLENIKKTELNLYHSCAIFIDKKRTQQKAIACKCVFLDIDFKDFHDLEEAKLTCLSQLDKLEGTPWHNTYNCVISTGNGIHVYWVFDDFMVNKEWCFFANTLTDTCLKKGIIFDTKVSRDIARIMRCPSSINQKNNSKTQILKLEKHINFSEFSKSFDIRTSVEQRQVVSKEKTTDVLTSLANSDDYSNVNVSAEILAEKCKFIKTFAETGLSGNEPAWRLALSIVRCCENGVDYCHKWSSHDPAYDFIQTQKKIDDLEKRGIGASSCAHCRDCGFCSDCLFFEKIQNPLKLGISPIKIKAEDLIADDREINDKETMSRSLEMASLHPTKERMWIVGNEGIFKIMEDIPVQMCHVPFFIIDLIADDNNDESVVTAVIRAKRNNRLITFNLPLKYLEDSKKLLGEFNSRRIFPSSKGLLKEYIAEYIKNLSAFEAQKTITSLGWNGDSFIFGQNGDGINDKCEFIKFLIDKKAYGYADGFARKGNIDDWRSMVAKISQTQEMYPHLFSILCSIGTPLLIFTAAKGFMLSLHGKSGTGKTLAHKVAMSVWGDPEKAGCIGALDTTTSRRGRVATAKNLPCRLDEATTLKAKDLAGLVFELVNGRGRSRATIDGSISSSSSEWQTMTLVTTNAPLLEKDANTISEAERCRLLEFEVLLHESKINVFREIGEMLNNAYGVAGVEILKFIIKNKKNVLLKLKNTQIDLQKQVADDKRFWVSCGAIAITGAWIARELKLIDIKIDELIIWFVAELNKQTLQTQNSLLDARGFETKEEFLHALLDHLNGKLLIMTSAGFEKERPKNEILGRYVENGGFDDVLYVSPSVVRNFVLSRDCNASYRNMLEGFGFSNAKPERLNGVVARYYKFLIKK